MAPTPTGEVIERERERGRIFALRFRAYGRRHFVTLGGAEEGWTRQKAEAELRHVLADVERGLWAPGVDRKAEGAQAPTFHEFASAWLEARRLKGQYLEYDPDTAFADLEERVRAGEPFPLRDH